MPFEIGNLPRDLLRSHFLRYILSLTPEIMKPSLLATFVHLAHSAYAATVLTSTVRKDLYIVNKIIAPDGFKRK